MTHPRGQVTLDATTGPGTLDAIQRCLDDFFTNNAHVPDIVRLNLSIAVAEIGANIIEHAGAGHPVHLHMGIELLADEVRVTFTDDGVPAQVNLTTATLPNDDAERGRGLALAKSTLGSLSYHRNAANHWTLVSQRFQDRSPFTAPQ